jgi:hypothetical protein
MSVRNYRTSARSVPSLRRVEQLTGVALTGIRSWVAQRAVQHLCYPPQRYPHDVGPGSVWQCACQARWLSHGVIVYHYPESAATVPQDVELGPEYWSWIEGTGNDDEERYQAQEPFWDWRSPEDRAFEMMKKGM